jgi:hypothetical protein
MQICKISEIGRKQLKNAHSPCKSAKTAPETGVSASEHTQTPLARLKVLRGTLGNLHAKIKRATSPKRPEAKYSNGKVSTKELIV